MTESTLTKKQLDRAELWGSFLFFCETFFPLVTGREFIISRPQGRESHHVTISRALTKVSRGEITNLLINVQPGSGKSVLLSMWVSWMMSRYPDSNFLYIAFSHDLASKHTAFIKRVMENSVYQYLFDVKIKTDSKAKDHFTTTAGGIVRGFSSGGPVTGADAGFMCDTNRFTGAVICFPYDEVVHTESGLMKIGDIVSKRIAVKVWSMNMHTKKFELKEINGWHKNPGSEILKVTLSDGSSVRCTPDHKIWTKNRGWVEAKDLQSFDNLPSPSLECFSALSNLRGSLHPSEICVFNNIYVFLGKVLKFPKVSIWPNTFGNSFPVSAAPYCSNSSWHNSILFGKRYSAFSLLASETYINSNLSIKLGSRSALKNWKSTMPLSVSNVLGFRSICKIFNTIISTISIKMPNLNTFFLRPNKSPRNKLMDWHLFCFRFYTKRNSKISFSRVIKGQFQYFFRNLVKFRPPRFFSFFRNSALFAPDSAEARNTINTFKTRNRSPLFIDNIGHENETFCISVKDNNNFVSGLGKGILCHNCDDMTKPDDCSSDTMRANILKNYQETILQRPRGPKVPMICIAQRLHEDDICAYMLSGNDERKWTSVILPSIDAAGNVLCPDVTPLEALREKQEKSPYVFASQYMQNPTAPGNSLFKRAWFQILDEEPSFLATFITCDTAESSKSYADSSVFSFWGLYKLSTGALALHWIDCWEEKLEPKDLEQAFLSFWADCMMHKTKPQFAAIEKKSTGVTLLSVLESVRGLQLREVKRTKASGSKTDRFLELQPILASKLVSLPAYKRHTEPCIAQAIKISANNTHRNDDLVDTLYDACRIALIDKTLYVDTIDDNDQALERISRAQQQRRSALQGSNNNGYYR